MHFPERVLNIENNFLTLEYSTTGKREGSGRTRHPKYVMFGNIRMHFCFLKVILW